MNSLPEAKHVLEIDEEGYPMFSQIRADDDELVGEILRNMHRSDPQRVSSRLYTTFAGDQKAWVSAFDDPLVVGSIDLGTKAASTTLTLNFLGNYKINVKLDELQMDSFNRLHVFVGPEKIPAVFSRKAQAELLNRPGIPELLGKPPFFRSSESPAERAEFWTELYKTGGDLWELGKVTPPLQSRMAGVGLKKGARVVVGAAGRGHEARFLETKGFAVTALDISTKAREEFLKVYPDSKVQYLCEDALAYQKNHKGYFDGFMEYTFYCAIPPALRPDYWKAAAAGLKPGGVLFGLFYLKTHPGGPPYGCTQWEIREFSRADFEIRNWEVVEDSIPRREGEELWVELVRK